MHSRLKMQWDDRPVKDVRLVSYKILNEGSETINSAEFILTLPSGTTILQAAVASEDHRAKCETRENEVRVCLPYVNPFREHEHSYELYLMTDGKFQQAEVRGSGEGWSLRYSTVNDPRDRRRLFLTIGIVGAVFGLAVNIYFFILRAALRHGLSWPILLLTTIALIIVLMVTYAMTVAFFW